MTDRWILREAAVLDGVLPRRERLLVVNGGLPGFTKFALTPTGLPVLRAEVPLDEDDEPELVAGDLETALGEARRQFHDGHARPRASTPDVEALRQRCVESGWPHTLHACGGAVFPLGNRSRNAVLELPEQGGVRVSTRLGLLPAEPDPGREAMCLFLLTLGGVVRFARPVLTPRGDRLEAACEVWFDSLPSPTKLAHALAALAVACRFGGAEFAALADAQAASAYLSVRGFGPDGCRGRKAPEREDPCQP